MRAWLLHGVFATILVGSLAAREHIDNRLVQNDDLEPAISRVARLSGLEIREEILPFRTGVPGLVFEAPGCSRPVSVFLLSTFDEVPIVRAASEPDDGIRYVYIDRDWKHPARLAFFVERMKYAALATLGLTQYVPSQRFLLIDAPSQCQIVDAIDWREVWSRDYLATTQAEIGAVTQ
jgi:hypothetical protein